RLYRNEGSADAPDLKVIYGEELSNPADRDQKSDLAGRRPAIGSPGMATVGETDYHRQAEIDFARHVADHLNGLALRNELSALIVAAPNRTLGELRKHFHRETRTCILAEIEKDLTAHPTPRIAELLVEREEVG
ncbi:MAG: host attachment protein, partial [Sphingobium sp.]|nr:host attachment protein [Sphingobium sp.]